MVREYVLTIVRCPWGFTLFENERNWVFQAPNMTWASSLIIYFHLVVREHIIRCPWGSVGVLHFKKQSGIGCFMPKR